MDSLAEHRINVIEAFQQLKARLDCLEICICDEDSELPLWFQCSNELSMPDDISPRQQVMHHLKQLEYLPNQNPKEILLSPGLIAASAKTIEAIEELNHAKQHFKNCILELKQFKTGFNDIELSHQMETILNYRDSTVTKSLQKIGLARLHLKQCYRVLPILEQRPDKVSWTWANTRAIKKISVEEALNRIEKLKRAQDLDAQKSKLKSLAFSEPLAVVQELAPHLRANIVVHYGDEITRKMVKGPVPIFYPHQAGDILPSIKPPGEKKARSEARVVRSDVKLDPEPFVPAIRVHRYLVKDEITEA